MDERLSSIDADALVDITNALIRMSLEKRKNITTNQLLSKPAKSLLDDYFTVQVKTAVECGHTIAAVVLANAYGSKAKRVLFCEPIEHLERFREVYGNHLNHNIDVVSIENIVGEIFLTGTYDLVIVDNATYAATRGRYHDERYLEEAKRKVFDKMIITNPDFVLVCIG